METQIAVDHEPLPDGRAHIVRALLKINAIAPAPTDERVPLNLSLVLDRSGSMGGEKLHQAREAAALLVRRLWPEDVVSVVAYDGEVVTVAEPATGESQRDLLARIGSIEARGNTNLSGGWLRGRELLAGGKRAGGKRAGGANRLLLLTDGQANAGITDPELLVGLCRTALEQGISTTTIGFGADYDEVLLRRMADAGGGNTYYIEQPDQAPQVFATELEGLMTLAAQNLRIDLRPTAAASYVQVHHQYPSQPLADGFRFELGDLDAREPRMLLVEFLVPVADPEVEVEIAELVVTAHVLTREQGVELREIRLPVRASLAGGAHVDAEVRRELLIQQAVKARTDALRARESGDHQGASDQLQSMCDLMTASAPHDLELREEAQELREMAELFRERRVNEQDAKYIYSRNYHSSTSRKRAGEASSRKRRKE